MQLTCLDANNCTIGEITPIIDALGYVVLRNALSLSQVQKLQNELEPHFEQRTNSQALFFGFNTKRIEALFSKSRIAQQMAIHPLVTQAVNNVLGANCNSVQINLTQGIRINPGEKAQMLHPDSALFPISQKPFEFQVNAMWAYSDFSQDNGATIIVPGSHKWPEGRTPKPEEITCSAMPAGSVLIYAASLLHGGGANITNTPRTGITISYCLGWLRQSENQYLSYPPEIAKTFGPELQKLIGYCVHKPNLGWVHGHDPIDLLTGTDNSHLGAQDFLTDQQKQLLDTYHQGQKVALTSHNL